MPSNSDSPGANSDRPQREPLAVIGIGCRLPGGIDSPSAFWDALLGGFDGIRDVPEDRWKHSRFHDTNPEKTGCIRNAKGGFMDGVDLFDAEFFGYFPNEAQRIDPQQRLLLEVTHEALEDAGVPRDQVEGTRTSVFIGSFMYDYLCIQSSSEQRDEINPYAAMGCALASISNRISYDFNLTGPSVTVDTACSGSLVALHLACRSLWGGEADLAIAGGVNVMLRPETSIMLSKGGFLNSDQYCKAFDAAANGYVRGEGVGIVILKPLSKALADGDAIYAWVVGSAVNQDGYSPEGFTVPNVFSQIALLESVYGEAGVDPLTVDYVEAHGTGTPVGDPIESLSLGAVLGRDRPTGQRCLMGSVKTNLGHLEGASGVTGFIKAVLTAQHGIAPPNLHFHEPNPAIDWDNIKLKVPTNATPLECSGRPWIVGVNSFGAGGANAHVVLQQPAETRAAGPEEAIFGPARPAAGATLYVLSSPQRDSLRTLALLHADFLGASPHRLDDAAFSAFTRRTRHENLVAVVGETAKEVENKLRKFADGQVDPTTLTTAVARRKMPKLGFVFSGQGGQWACMGQQWMQRETVFREWMEAIDAVFQRLSGWSLLAELGKSKEESKINDTVVVQPAVLAIQISLAKLYEHYGIRPQGAVGHSIGEVAAAFCAGALTLEQAVHVIYHRSQAQNQASGKGGMLAIGLGMEEASQLIGPYEGRVSIAAVNGPEMLTLSGDPEPLADIAAKLEARGVFNRPVRVQVAYHSHHMDSIRGVMLEALAHSQGVAAAMPLYSTVTGRRENGLHLNADYWFQNVRQPVLFTNALGAMLQSHFDTFVEIGPHPVLVGGANALINTQNTNALVTPSMTRREPEVTVFLQSLAQLAARGIAPDTERVFGPNRRYIRLPKYPWKHNRYWFESPAAAEIRRGPFEHPFLKRQTELVTEEGLAVWESALDVQRFPYLRDHQVDGEIVFPASGHVELAWAVASEQFRHDAIFLEDLHFDSPLMLSEDSRHPLAVRMEIVSSEGDYRILSRAADAPADSPWSKHSSGRINTMRDRFEESTASPGELCEHFREGETLPIEQFYEKLHAAGMSYGANFRCIQELQYRDHEWLARLRLPDELVHESQRNAVHPALLDACLHVVFADCHRQGNFDRVYLPSRIDRVRFDRKPTQEVWARVRMTRNDEQYLCSDTLILDAVGDVVGEIRGLTGKRLVGAGSRQTETAYEGCYEYHWVPAAREEGNRGRIFDTTRAVFVADEDGVAAELGTRLAAEGIEPLVVPPGDSRRFDDVFADVPLDRRTLIVFAAGLSTGNPAWKGLAGCPSVPLLLQLAQALQKREGVPRLYLVTNGAADVAGDQQLDLGQAVLHGMARVIRNEWPQVPLTLIDLSASIPSSEVDALVSELLYTRRDEDESEIALRGEERYVRQLLPLDRDSAEQAAAKTEEGFGGEFRAELTEPGVLDQVAFRRRPSSDPGEQDVEIAVRAAGLAFKDVMNAMGMLPDTAIAGGLTSQRLGMEVAGRVLRTGSLVPDLRAGDEVMARVPEGFCGRVTTPRHCVVRRPENLTPVQAAAVPVAYVTAWYSLCHLARMTRGENVLIHSAAGGVGGAGIQLACRAGATVIATAGTQDKREYLRQQGVEHVFDSHSLDFYNRVMEVTGGRGVDIVLNSLPDRFIVQGLKCLAPFGRFIELGKSDIYRNNKLGLERLGENISYFVVDVDRLALRKPELHQQVLNDIAALFERGEVETHEITEFAISKLSDAMRFMTRGTHRGKIVLNMQNDRVRTLPPRHVNFQSDRSYLVSAGASGFGLEIARWMCGRGARNLVLVSRSGPKTDADRAAVETMMEQGVRVLLAQTDVTDGDAVRRLLDRIQRDWPPLAGVIHGAAVMDDASIPAMNMGRFERVFAPKAQGAWNLHEAMLAAGVDLDFFLMLSSISSALGFVGQVNYAAANYFEDALAQYRRQQGLPATSLNVGVMGQYAGLSRTVNENQDVIGLLESQGLLVMPLADILAKLEAALIQQPVQRVTGRFDWGKFRLAYPHLVRDVRFVELLSDAALARGNRPKSSNLRAELSELGPDQRHERLQQELATKLGRILDTVPEKLDPAASIDILGLDSLMLTDLQVWIARTLDITLPLIKLLKGPSITTLAAELLTQLDAGEARGPKPPGDDVSGFTLADVEGVQIVNPWLIRGSGDPDAPSRLICFHSMGVGASLFTRFLLNPPQGYDILAVQTPGRENREAEPACESVDELVDQIAPLVQPLFDRPVVFWGHSFGGIVAREVMRRLRDEHDLEPNHFVLTGTAAPHLMHRWQNREVLLKALVEDNTPEYLMSLSRYVENPGFIAAILPGMRRDFPLLKNYRFAQSVPLHCPITAFAARQDDMVYTDEIREWIEHTDGGFQLIDVDGDHWFLDRNRELITATLQDIGARCQPAPTKQVGHLSTTATDR